MFHRHILRGSQRCQIHDLIRFCQQIKIPAELQKLGPAYGDSRKGTLFFQYLLTLYGFRRNCNCILCKCFRPGFHCFSAS